jgi:hypothetical protein
VEIIRWRQNKQYIGTNTKENVYTNIKTIDTLWYVDFDGDCGVYKNIVYHVKELSRHAYIRIVSRNLLDRITCIVHA